MTMGMAHAQDQNEPVPFDARNDNNQQQGDVGQAGDTQQNSNQGVVRLARFSYVKGNVTWRPDPGVDWSAATTNLPLRQDAQIWVTDGGRAELQFDDGSVLRLGNGALLTLKTLYSDEDGEFTQITLNEGLVTLRARHERGVYRIDTPLASITAKGPAKVRFGIADGLELAVRQGQANVEGSAGKVTLESGDYLDLRDAQSPLDLRRLPREDNWDQWNQERDAVMDGSVSRPSHQHLPANIEIVATNLDDYGSWRNDPDYGYVWCPRVASADWRPYHDGRWTWVNPFGWTWVSDESWGWAPYHYGTWVSRGYGWAWCPGPVNQYWSPAVVHFSEYQDRVAWVALAPREVHYPAALSIGFRSGNWSAFFSIGQAAVYYPTYNNYCEARPFRTGYVNHVTYVNNITNVTNVYNTSSPSFNRYYNSAEFYGANHNTYLQNNRFVPYNARAGAGVSVVATSGFGRRTAYQVIPRAESASFFTNGRTVTAPTGRAMPVAGPIAARPTRESLTPTHAFIVTAQPPSRAGSRAIFQAPLPATIARRAAPITPSGQMMRQNPVNPTAQTGRLLPPSVSTGRGNTQNGSVSSQNNGSRVSPRELGNGTRTSTGNATGSANTGVTNPRTGTLPRDPGNTSSYTRGQRSSGDSSVSSAAEEARRARGSLGLPSTRTGTGNGTASSGNRGSVSGNSGNGNTGSFGSPRSNGSDAQNNRTYRDANGNTRTNRPNTDSSGTTSTPRSGSGTSTSSGRPVQFGNGRHPMGGGTG